MAAEKYGIKAYGLWTRFSTKARYRAYLMTWIASTEGSERDRAVSALRALEEGIPEYDSDEV